MKNIDKTKLDEIKKYALGDDDMNAILGDNLFIFVYPYLDDVKHIDDVFDNEGRSLMLYLVNNINSGHWVCMIKKDNKILYFDPYGKKPDNIIDLLDDRKKDELDMEQKKLTSLLKNSGYDVFYNTFPYQKLGDNINTCGRHCALRLLHRDLSDIQYHNLINKYIKKYNLNTDETVSLLIYNILGK
jgi:hypothetical protein